MSLAYIRDHYKVPVKMKMRIKFMPSCFPNESGKGGIIVGSRGSYLRIKTDGTDYPRLFHPTYGILYPSE